jgi:hypothetical protein
LEHYEVFGEPKTAQNANRMLTGPVMIVIPKDADKSCGDSKSLRMLTETVIIANP